MSTDAALLASRARPLGCELGERDARRLLLYLDLMLAANRRLSLTGIRDREDAVVLHVLDSLAAAGLGISPTRCLDLGSGNGFPGVALSVLWPCEVVLMDRTGKKVKAMQNCLERAGFEHCRALQMDAAMAPSLRPDLVFDLVAARAVAPAGELGSLAAPLTGRDGHLCLWRDRSAAPHELPGGFTLQRTLDYRLPSPRARQMRLALYRKR